MLAWVGDARILALRLDKFDNSHFASDYAVQATTSASYQDMLTLTQTPQAVDHAIIAIGRLRSGLDHRLRLRAGAGCHQPLRGGQRVANSAGYRYLGIVSKQTLTATSTSWKWQTKAEVAGTTVNADELAIAVLQLGATPAAGGRRRYMALAG